MLFSYIMTVFAFQGCISFLFECHFEQPQDWNSKSIKHKVCGQGTQWRKIPIDYCEDYITETKTAKLESEWTFLCLNAHGWQYCSNVTWYIILNNFDIKLFIAVQKQRKKNMKTVENPLYVSLLSIHSCVKHFFVKCGNLFVTFLPILIYSGII